MTLTIFYLILGLLLAGYVALVVLIIRDFRRGALGWDWWD